MSVRQPVLGVVLAGGLGLRLGGINKAMLRIDGRTFLECVLRAVGPSVDRVVVVASAGQEIEDVSLAAPVPVRVVRDSSAGQGPLAAVIDGLHGAGCRGDSIAVVASCDVPRLSAEVVRLLVEAIRDAGETCDWVVPEVGGHPQVLLSAMRGTLLPAAQAFLTTGRRDLKGLLSLVRVLAIGEERLRRVDPSLASFRDVDTPGDLQALA